MRSIGRYSAWIVVDLGLLAIYFQSFSCGCFPVADSIAIGVFSSIFAVLLFQLIPSIKMYFDFHGIEGENWKEYCSSGADFSVNYDFSKPTGKASIKYRQDNILSIELTTIEKGKSWTGDTWYGTIQMNKDQNKTGRISWKYEAKENKHIFGLKECINTEDDKWEYIYLMSVNYGLHQRIRRNLEGESKYHEIIDPKYGNVVLRRKKRG